MFTAWSSSILSNTKSISFNQSSENLSPINRRSHENNIHETKNITNTTKFQTKHSQTQNHQYCNPIKNILASNSTQIITNIKTANLILGIVTQAFTSYKSNSKKQCRAPNIIQPMIYLLLFLFFYHLSILPYNQYTHK